MEHFLKVSEVARRLGCSADWLRDAEKRGKIPKARRDLNGWRAYASEDIAALRAMLLPTVPNAGRNDRGSGQNEGGAGL